MSSIINSVDKFKSDILAMITNGTSNDVKILLEDGEILANKDVLCARSDYFSTMFSNNNQVRFVEGETNKVDMTHCSKVVMEKIIKYLFSGDMELHDLSLPDLVKMLNIATMMMLEDIHQDIKEFVLEIIPDSGEDCAILPQLISTLMLAENFKFEDIKEALVHELFMNLKDIPHIPEVVQNSEAFKMLPVNLLKDILFKYRKIEDKDRNDGGWSLFLKSYVEEDDEDYIQPDETDEDTDDYTEYTDEDTDDYFTGPYVKLPDEDKDHEDDENDDEDDCEIITFSETAEERFHAFMFWLSGNVCSEVDKKEIKDSIDLIGGCFTPEKLLTDVRRSGLFSIKEVDGSVFHLVRRMRAELEMKDQANMALTDYFTGVISQINDKNN